MTVRLDVDAVAGHSSAPPFDTAIGILSKAIVALEENQFPAYVYPMEMTLRALSQRMCTVVCGLQHVSGAHY